MALRVFREPGRAVRSQSPMLVLVILYTIISLWIPCSRSSKRIEGGKGGFWWNGLNPPGIMCPFFYAVIVA